jgi:branched-chain amino acid transport system substrate-binding protein
MSSWKQRIFWVAAAIAVTAVVVGCGSSSGESGSGGGGGGGGGEESSSGPIVIGMSASETGPYAVDGILSLRGVEAAIQQANENGGWMGRELELKVIDDGSEASKAQQAYQKLITQENVDFVIGPYAPDLAAAAGAVATRYEYVMLDPETALPIVSGSKWAIMDEPGADHNMDGFPSVVQEAGYKSLAVLGVNNAYGEACMEGIEEEAEEVGLKVAYSSSYSEEADFNSTIEAVKGSGAEALASCSFFSDGVSVTRALSQVGYTPKVFGLTIAPSEKKYASSVGNLANLVISNTSWDQSFKTEGNPEFIKTYEKMFHEAPDYHAANNYAAVQALGEAVEKAKSTEQGKVLETLYGNTFETVLGEFKIDENEAISTGYDEYLYQNQNGTSKLIYPKEVAQAKVITPYTGH